jgi:poly-gamma-glutamate synthesis protein (capsule biosynthesis protein)
MEREGFRRVDFRKISWLKLGLFGVSGIIGVALLVFGVLWTINSGSDSADSDLAVVEEVCDEACELAKNPVIVSAETRILAGGNIFWGRRTNTEARKSPLGVAYPFLGFASMEREKYDGWIAGLECPITNRGHNNYEEEKLLKFNCDPDYLPEAAKYFTAVSLANNHTDNQGVAGFKQTKEYLAGAGIQHFGHYDYRDTASGCTAVILPVRISMSDGSSREYKIPLGFCGHHGVFGVPTDASLKQIEKWSKILPVISMPHMGAEYKAVHDNMRQKTYRKMIDYGAEMVLGDHPHWVQDTEVYQDRLIVYSMGNFMFDQAGSQEVLQSAAFDLTASFVDGTDFEKWSAVSEECEKDFMKCYEVIASAIDSGLSRLSVSWEYDFVAVMGNAGGKYVPGLASEQIRAGIAERLNWEETKRKLTSGSEI